MVDGVKEDGVELVVIATAPLDWTVFTAAWVPSSPRVAAAGCTLAGQGQLRVFSLAGQKGLAELAATSTPQALRCGTFQSSGPEERHYCTGDFGGGLAVWDLESLNAGPVDHVAAHADLVNCIAGEAGEDGGRLVTGGRDGLVRVWDHRCFTRPATTIEGEPARDCWSVSLAGDTVKAGYSNGDIRHFDLRAGAVSMDVIIPFPSWEGQASGGVSCLQGGVGPTMLAGTAAGLLCTWDEVGSKSELRLDRSTVWAVAGSAQQQDTVLASTGSGALHLLLAGSLTTSLQLTDKPVTSLNWNTDRAGLAVTTSFDQNIRVVLVIGPSN